jgi:hypothetical protein
MKEVLRDIKTQDAVIEIATPESSNIDFVRYSYVTEVLQVEYKGKKRYNYLGLPNDVVKDLRTSESVGSFVNKVIKPNYEVESTEINLFTKTV